jgi:hypothetical protein
VLGDQRGEILFTNVHAFIKRFLGAQFVELLLGFVGKALTVRGLVVNDGDLRILEMVEDILTGNDALLVVTAAGAERVPQLALGIDRIGRGRRDFENAFSA